MFKGCNLKGSKFINSNFNGTTFNCCILDDVDFKGSTFEDVDFFGSDITLAKNLPLNYFQGREVELEYANKCLEAFNKGYDTIFDILKEVYKEHLSEVEIGHTRSKYFSTICKYIYSPREIAIVGLIKIINEEETIY